MLVLLGITLNGCGSGSNSSSDPSTGAEVGPALAVASTTSSTSHTDYRGTTIGGGARITRTGLLSFALDILGTHKVRTRANGSKAFDVSVRTTQSVEGHGELDGDRVLESGTIEVAHNQAEYVAEITLDEVKFTTGCCYPTSGQMNVTYSGSISGTATVTFPSCGTISFKKNDVTSTFTLAGCE